MKRLVSCLVLLACVAWAQDDEPLVARRKPSEMPKAALSAGGFVKVVAADVPGDPLGFRLPILQFTTRNLRELEKAYKLEMPRREGPGLVIYALDGKTNDTRVIVRAVRRDGSFMTRVWLPSPGFSDLDQLRFEIARAYLRAWIDRAAGRGVTPGELPDWVVQGAMRAADAQTAHDDVRFVLNLWSSARLPFFPALCTDLRVSKGKAAALPGYIAGWIRERKLLGKLMREKWDGRRLAELLTGETDPARQDRASDERLARLARSVLEPGECGLWELDFFSSRLSLRSPVFAVKIARGEFSCPFRDAISENGTNLLLRTAAFLKAREVPLYALGRGEELQGIADGYTRFLFSLAGGEPAEKLVAMLDSVDSRLERAYEKRRKDHNGQR